MALYPFLPGSHLNCSRREACFVRLPSGGTGFEQLLDPNQVQNFSGRLCPRGV